MIFCKIPRAGLGNQLFVIAHAIIFAKNNSQKITFLNFSQLKIGPYLRRERTKRQYNNFFVFQKGIIALFVDQIKFKLMGDSKFLIEPELEIKAVDMNALFSEIPHYSDYFIKLRPYREVVKAELFNFITKENRDLINQLSTIDVAVHVRLGDFQKLQKGVSFAKVGATRTPMEYFIDSIAKIKERYPSYRFFIFTDGYKTEVSQLLEIEGVQFFESINDIVDLYQMSKSKILITSAGSTYSYWAGFLGDCEIIQHPDHIHKIV